jgi:hypothetical protein
MAAEGRKELAQHIIVDFVPFVLTAIVVGLIVSSAQLKSRPVARTVR